MVAGLMCRWSKVWSNTATDIITSTVDGERRAKMDPKKLMKEIEELKKNNRELAVQLSKEKEKNRLSEIAWSMKYEREVSIKETTVDNFKKSLQKLREENKRLKRESAAETPAEQRRTRQHGVRRVKTQSTLTDPVQILDSHYEEYIKWTPEFFEALPDGCPQGFDKLFYKSNGI